MNQFIISISILLVASTASAQNFGGKLGEKLNSKIKGTEGPSKKDAEEATQDSLNTLLDSKAVLKDAPGISGIYYSTAPITVQTMGNNPMTNQPFEKQVKKFLVNYDETKFNLTLNNQYSYETNNETKWVKAALWASTTEPKKLGPEISIKAGGLYLSSTDYDNRKYKYLAGYTTKKDLQGNEIQGELIKTDWNSKEILVIEPGVLLIGNLQVSDETLESNKKYREVIVLFKAEKSDVAAKYTREYAWDQIHAYWKKYNSSSNENEASSTQLAKPLAGKIKDEPSNIDLRKAVEARMTQYKWGETLEYVYIISDWKNKFEKLGVNQLNTLVSRTLQVQVVTKKGDRCRSTIMQVIQENVFSTGSVEENFSGQPIKDFSNGATSDIDCKRAFEYKK